jgi:hypothetical protein
MDVVRMITRAMVRKDSALPSGVGPTRAAYRRGSGRPNAWARRRPADVVLISDDGSRGDRLQHTRWLHPRRWPRPRGVTPGEPASSASSGQNRLRRRSTRGMRPNGDTPTGARRHAPRARPNVPDAACTRSRVARRHEPSIRRNPSLPIWTPPEHRPAKAHRWSAPWSRVMTSEPRWRPASTRSAPPMSP